MRYRGRIDANHKALREFFRAHGVLWLDLSNVGSGCADALVKSGDRLALIEVKDGAKVKSAQKLTPAQIEFHAAWGVFVVNDEPSAQTVIGWLKHGPAYGTPGYACRGRHKVFIDGKCEWCGAPEFR